MFQVLVPLLALAPLVAPQETLQHREVRVLELSGTPRERGLAHGRALGPEIRELLGDFERDLERRFGVAADEFRERFLAQTEFAPTIERWVPGLLEEVAGIAEGAEVSFERLFLWQLNDEIWSLGKGAMQHHCTSIAVNRRGDQPTLVAQNMDIPGFYQKFPTLLRIRDARGPDQLLLTCPGMIGVNGMNAAGVAVTCNTLLQLRPSPKGVPCLFVVRGILTHENLADARAWLQRIPHAVGQNYTIGDPTAAQAFECSAGGQVEFRPDAAADFTYHTNHPLVSTDWHPDYVEQCKELEVSPRTGPRHCWRFDSLGERIRPGAPIKVETIRAALASRDHEEGPICGDWTYGCTVFVLEEEQPYLELSPGRPDRVAAQRFEF
jgi:isopenicillin-N N-acyltransferase-like protein